MLFFREKTFDFEVTLHPVLDAHLDGFLFFDAQYSVFSIGLKLNGDRARAKKEIHLDLQSLRQPQQNA